jgi:transposase
VGGDPSDGVGAGVAIRAIARRTGRHRDTVREALSSPEPPRYSRPAKGSVLDPFKDEVHRLLGDDARIPSQRIREPLAEQGYRGGKTITE